MRENPRPLSFHFRNPHCQAAEVPFPFQHGGDPTLIHSISAVMASPKAEGLRDPPAPAPAGLIDELLEDIFFRLPTPADLARAAAACPTFRRIITDHSFHRRYRALHPAPLLGMIPFDLSPRQPPRPSAAVFIPAQPPHPSAALARAFAAADFSCSFLPSPDRWLVRDFCDGRALLSSVPDGGQASEYNRRNLVSITDLAVCDPLRRRYVLLPSIPVDLVATIHQPDMVDFQPFLAPAAEDERGTSYRVICLAQVPNKLVLFVYSSDSGQWHAAAFDGWSKLVSGTGNPKPESSQRHYAHGCFYWLLAEGQKLLVFDTHSFEFSDVDLPHDPLMDNWQIIDRVIIEAGEGRIGMLTLCGEYRSDKWCLWHTVLQNGGQGAEQWHAKPMIPLPTNYQYRSILGLAGEYLLLCGLPVDKYLINFPNGVNMDYFSLNLKTFQLEWFCEIENIGFRAKLYVGFPPSLSPPTI
ncbi:hypothetical protein ACP70R_005321 [Stipagrostis hirtigluma subsp. patula]